jgi:hypothetical protein
VERALCSSSESHGSWDYPNRGHSKYFLTLNRIHATTLRVALASTRSPTIVEFSLQNFLWTEEECDKREGLFNVSERGYYVLFTVSVWDETIGDNFVGAHLQPNDKLTEKKKHKILKTYLSGGLTLCL